MNEIYLISSDGHRDSIDLKQYFTTDEQLIDFVEKDFLECNYGAIINSSNCFVDLDNNKIIAIYYYDDWDVKKEYIDCKFYYTFKLKLYECF
jgi:hypothetical protein